MRNYFIFIILGLIVWSLWRSRKHCTNENFVLDVPNSVDIETVSSEVLESYKVYKASAMNHDEIIEKCTSLEAEIGVCKTYTVNDMSLKAFVEDVYNSKGDYTELLHKYVSFPMGIVYNSDSNNILYYTVEKPWNLKPNIFQDKDYIGTFEAGKVYVPQWSYSRSDPGPLSIDPQCLKILNSWKDSDDSHVIKQLEQSKCLSRSNKIKFVGMILLQYLKTLKNNRFGFSRACDDFKGITSNIRNPELQKIFDDINLVCNNQGNFSDGIEQDCVTPVNAWLRSGEETSSTACLSAAEKSNVISRITKLLEIGDTIPVDFLDSFYLVVAKLYSDTKNDLLKDALRGFASTSDRAEKWKSLFDSLYKNTIRPRSVMVNSKAIPDAGLDGKGWKGAAMDFPLTVTYVFDQFYKFNTILTQAVDKFGLSKYALSYEDPFFPEKYVDFERVLYGNDSTKVDNLNGIITKRIKIKPLEKGDVGVKIGFEGTKVALDKCSQKVSVCDMDSSLSNERSRTDSMRRRYELERKNRMEMLQKLSTMTGDVRRLKQELGNKDAKLGQRCPPQKAPLPAPSVVVKKQFATPPPTTYILLDSLKKSTEEHCTDDS